MNASGLRRIGSIDLVDLDIISKSYGRDFLPYPFMLTQPSRFPTHDAYAEYAASVPDRFDDGDLRTFRRWAACYAYADIRVELHVQYIPADTPSIRVMAHRRDELGFLAQQRADEDVIDVDELSAYGIGTAVADTVELTKPGGLSEIVIPEYVRRLERAPEPEGLSTRHVVDTPTAATVPRGEVTAYGTAQTHWRPTRQWGPDPGKNSVVWVRLKDDGDYLYAPDFSVAKPMKRNDLARRIDGLISEDVAVLRQFRSG